MKKKIRETKNKNTVEPCLFKLTETLDIPGNKEKS